MNPVSLFRVATTIAVLAVSSPAAAAEPDVTAFVHVNVVPMDRDRVLADQTVLVDDGIITAVGGDLKIPAGARVIDGRDKFLSPGLADMHTHSESREDMKVYLVNGVTSILNLGGASSDFVDQRVPLLNRGEKPGPHVYLALRIDGTPQFGQLVVKTPDEARWATRLAKSNGYQFVKVYNNLSVAALDAVEDEASKDGLGLAGHYVRDTTLEHQLEPGNVLVAHLEELLYGSFTPPEADPLSAPDEKFIPQLVNMLKRNHAFVVGDLVTFETIAGQWGRPDVLASYLARPETRFVPFEWRLDWRRQNYAQKNGSLARRVEFLAKLAKALSDGGVGIVAGTDAPTIPGIVPGFSLHDDIDRLVAAGLSRYDALSTATRMPGEFIRQSIGAAPSFGEVRPGYRADLVLSQENPLENLGTLRSPDGVMAAGRWYDRAQLQQLLREVESDYSAAAAIGADRLSH